MSHGPSGESPSTYQVQYGRGSPCSSGMAGEEQEPLAVDAADLRHLELAEHARLRQRRREPPVDHVVAARVGEHAVEAPLGGRVARGDEHVPRAAVAEDERVAPGLAASRRGASGSGTGRATRARRATRRHVIRSSDSANPMPLVLDGPPLGVERRVVHAPDAVVAARDRAGPQREIVEARGRRARARRRAPPTSTRSSELACPIRAASWRRSRIAERARRPQGEQVVALAVVGDPAVPDPVLPRAEHERQ